MTFFEEVKGRKIRWSAWPKGDYVIPIRLSENGECIVCSSIYGFVAEYMIREIKITEGPHEHAHWEFFVEDELGIDEDEEASVSERESFFEKVKGKKIRNINWWPESYFFIPTELSDDYWTLSGMSQKGIEESYDIGKISNWVILDETIGKKFDKGKARFDLIKPEFEKAFANILTLGAAKYGEDNWVNVEDYRYRGALRRHYNEYELGVKEDAESKEHPLIHVAVNAMFLYLKEMFPDKYRKEGK